MGANSKRQAFLQVFENRNFNLTEAVDFCLTVGLIDSDVDKALDFYHKYQTRSIVTGIRGKDGKRRFLSYRNEKTDIFSDVMQEKKSIKLKGVEQRLSKLIAGTKDTKKYVRKKRVKAEQIEGQLSLFEYEKNKANNAEAN